ncbi:uncharacterized protein TNCV_2084251 [Trichonephila clavipes]|uniref:Mos1 transposase HTH domain-containing protein n=1 Tax=Trichonephila clavipes TaxID=2585209 RepID=A0A8X6RKH1_TRICX|nr:uncharacterized protein TNCV_2084251 [Trichonephila clavipes]
MSAADIHHQITEAYGTEVMSDSRVRKWVRKFKDGRTNVHDEERLDLASVIIYDLMQAIETKIVRTGDSRITTLSLEFPDVSRLVVYKIVTEDLNFKKLCSLGGYPDYSKEHRKEVFHFIGLFDSLRGRRV